MHQFSTIFPFSQRHQSQSRMKTRLLDIPHVLLQLGYDLFDEVSEQAA